MRVAHGHRTSGRGWRWWIVRLGLPPFLLMLFLLQSTWVPQNIQDGTGLSISTSAAGTLSWDERMRELDERRGHGQRRTQPQTAKGQQGQEGKQLSVQIAQGLDLNHLQESQPTVASGWPPSNPLSKRMLEFNSHGRWVNGGRESVGATLLGPGVLPIVLYVHNRPRYLRVVLEALSQVRGIDETVLIVSHDGYYEEVAKMVRDIKFTKVKQVFAPYSPHNFVDSFPNVTPGDCPERPSQEEVSSGCRGDADQYGNYRAPRIVSLKHHWFWLMNHVWGEMEELRGFDGHIMFMEEDHVIAPNAYQTLQVLAKAARERCPNCVAINLGMPLHDGGDPGGEYLVADWMANMGYAFNRSTWERLKKDAQTFCTYSDYNWDETIKWSIMSHWAPVRLGLHAAGPPIMHMGKCGLHGHTNAAECAEVDNEVTAFLAQEADRPPPIDIWEIRETPQDLSKMGFSGWGGWGDRRDQKLCMYFASLPEGLTAERRH